MSVKKDETQGAAQVAVDPNEELVDYTAPPDYTNKESRDIFVAVNGESIRIKRGVPVRIKRKFLKALQAAGRQDAAAQEYIRRNEKRV